MMSRRDREYPQRLRQAGAAPPLLYGTGNPELLDVGGLAVVGSRDADQSATEYTRELARCCATQQVQVVSGSAPGVDAEAMTAALDSGGTAIGILADSLIRTSVSSRYRQALLDHRLVLATPYDPSGGFSVGNALGRNRHIHALDDWSLIVGTSTGKGGTWAGAVEALKAGRELFVRAEGDVPEGNLKRSAKGAHAFPPRPRHDLRAAIKAHAAISTPPEPAAGQTAGWVQRSYVDEMLTSDGSGVERGSSLESPD